MSTPAEDIIAAARMQVHDRHPYLSATLFSLRPHPAPGLGTLAVDQHWRLYYDPETVLEWDAEYRKGLIDRVGGSDKWHHGIAAVIYHEMGHVLRQHHQRRGDRDPAAANAAMDREINDDLPEAGWRLPGKPLMPKDIVMPDGLTFEEYYKTTAHIGECEDPKAGNVPGSGGACGGIAGNPTEWEKSQCDELTRGQFTPGGAGDGSAPSAPPFPEPVSPLEQQISLRKTALDIQQHAKSRGRVPAGLKAWAETMLRPATVNWRKKLASLVRQSLATCAGACDFTWQKTGRRALHGAGRAGWPLAPALHQPVPKVAIVLDTSGSMGCEGEHGTVLDEALSEVYGIVKASGGDCWGVACDAEGYGPVRLGSVRDLERLNKGGGGTVLTEGITQIERVRPSIIVVLTDGFTNVPEKPPKAKLIWGIFGGNEGFTAPGDIVMID